MFRGVASFLTLFAILVTGISSAHLDLYQTDLLQKSTDLAHHTTADNQGEDPCSPVDDSLEKCSKDVDGILSCLTIKIRLTKTGSVSSPSFLFSNAFEFPQERPPKV